MSLGIGEFNRSLQRPVEFAIPLTGTESHACSQGMARSTRVCHRFADQLRKHRRRSLDLSSADTAVNAFAQQIGMPAVPGVLLDPVYQQLPDGDTVLP